jgi:nucleoside-diphosphate-sugar epimerase
VVIGPPIIIPDSGLKLNETLQPIYNILSGSVSEIPAQIGSGAYVDVRDVAAMHVWAFENPEKANGERYIAATSYGPPQGVADILRYKYRGTKIAEKILVGNPGKGYIGYDKKTGEVSEPDYLPEFPRPSAKKAQESMGLTWIPFKQSVIETAKALEPLL